MSLKKLIKISLTLIIIILSLFIIKYLKIYTIIKELLTILLPLFIGFAYAWFINPLIRKLSKKRSRHLISIIIFLTIIILIACLLYFIIPIIYKEMSEVLKILPDVFSTIESKIDNMGLNNYLDKLLSLLLDNGPTYLLNFIKNIFKYLGTICLGLILGLYISMDYPHIVRNILKLSPKKYQCITTTVSKEVSDEVRKCIYGTLTIAFFIFLSSSISFYFIKIDAPLIFGLLCGITDLIPYIGPYIGGIIVVLVGLTKSKLTGIITIIICIIIQSIENYCLQPLIMSKKINLSPILIIIGLLVFGRMLGIIGMVLATPLVATIKVLIENIKLAKKKCQ